MIYIMSFKEASVNRVYNREALATQLDAKIYIGENPCMNFVEILKLNKGKDLLLLEDDVRLCNNFVSKLYTALNKFPNQVINFHYNYGDTLQQLPVKHYGFNQCVFFPAKIAENMIKPCTDFIKHYLYFVKNKDYSVQIKYGLMHSGAETFIAYEPKLVEHLNLGSAIGNKHSPTRNFIDEKETV